MSSSLQLIDRIHSDIISDVLGNYYWCLLTFEDNNNIFPDISKFDTILEICKMFND